MTLWIPQSNFIVNLPATMSLSSAVFRPPVNCPVNCPFAGEDAPLTFMTTWNITPHAPQFAHVGLGSCGRWFLRIEIPESYRGVQEDINNAVAKIRDARGN